MSIEPVTLKGMTWSHPRGYDPLVACSAVWQARGRTEVVWDQRSLQDFESYPVKDLAERYDLIVIDHPHVGQIVGEGCLTPLDGPDREAERQALAAGSVGRSFESYRLNDRQWAFPIDAATQVQAWRPDRIPRPVRQWDELEVLAGSGKVALPLRPPHSLMCLFTLLGQSGAPARIAGPELIDPLIGARAFGRLATLVSRVDPACYGTDPIAAFEAMAQADSAIACIPLTYGYVSYARERFRPARLHFADIPRVEAATPVGSSLGGTGIAVSAYSRHQQAALDFAYWIASGDVQRGPYAAAGGQPGHAAAWEDDGVNAPVADFYRATRQTLEGAWVRPRHDGYMTFQHAAADRLNAGLRSHEPAARVIGDLNRLFRDSVPA